MTHLPLSSLRSFEQCAAVPDLRHATLFFVVFCRLSITRAIGVFCIGVDMDRCLGVGPWVPFWKGVWLVMDFAVDGGSDVDDGCFPFSIVSFFDIDDRSWQFF